MSTHGLTEGGHGVGHLVVVNESYDDDVRLLDGVQGSHPRWTLACGHCCGLRQQRLDGALAGFGITTARPSQHVCSFGSRNGRKAAEFGQVFLEQLRAIHKARLPGLASTLKYRFCQLDHVR